MLRKPNHTCRCSSRCARTRTHARTDTHTHTHTHTPTPCSHTPDRLLLLPSLCIFVDLYWIFVSLSVVCLTVVLAMEWTTFWYLFCASMPPGSRVICVCMFLHLTVSLMYQCPPFSVAQQRLQEPSVQSCAHAQSLRDSYVRTGYSDPLKEDLSGTPLHQTACVDPPRRYSPDQIIAIQASTPDPSLTSRLRNLRIGCLLRK